MNLLKYLQRAGVPETLQPGALASLQRAEEIASHVAPYKWSAPLVMALVVPWLKWSAEKLPAFFSRRNVGWKINNVPHNQHTTANVTWITWSLLRWKGEE